MKGLPAWVGCRCLTNVRNLHTLKLGVSAVLVLCWSPVKVPGLRFTSRIRHCVASHGLVSTFAVNAGASTGTPASWALRRAGVALPEAPELELPLADPFAFLEQHRERLGAHARAVHGLAPQVPAQRLQLVPSACFCFVVTVRQCSPLAVLKCAHGSLCSGS